MRPFAEGVFVGHGARDAVTKICNEIVEDNIKADGTTKPGRLLINADVV